MFSSRPQQPEGAHPIASPIVLSQLAVAVGATASFFGWLADIPRLTDWNQTGISIQPNTALAIASAAFGTFLLFRGKRTAARCCGFFSAAVALLVLIEYAVQWDFGVDGLFLFGRPWGGTAVTHPGRMGIPAAISLSMLGTALSIASSRSESSLRRTVPGLCLIPLSIAGLGLVGYLYGAQSFYQIPAVTAIALQTASFICIISIGLLWTVPELSPVRFFTESGPAGMLARRALPALVLVPIFLGLFQLLRSQAGLYDEAFGSALRTISEIVLFMLFLGWTSLAIDRQTRERERADEALRVSRSQIATLLEKERAARAEAERAARIKDEFLAVLSHELRTPLNAVIGWAQLLKKNLLEPEKARTAVDVIDRNARLQARLITDLLDISRIVSGNMRLDEQPVDLAAVIDAAIDSIRPAAEEKNILLRKQLQPQSAPISGDAGRLQQVVWNLLSNAVKFTPAGGTVRVALTHRGGFSEIRITDTGEGIAADFLPHIFERFRQADASSSRSYGGLGIGLALVKQFVELHRGIVEAESAGRGKGASFIIRLPLNAEEGTPRFLESSPSSTVSQSQEQISVLSGKKVLIVDDEPDALSLLRHLFEEQLAEVTGVSSAEAALAELDTEQFAVIVSDIAMPSCDGYEFIRRARMTGIDTPAIAVTAFARREDEENAKAAGFQAHVTKPVDVGVLFSAVTSLLLGEIAASAEFRGRISSPME